MFLVVCGEISSFVAYAFVPASLVTAIGSLAILPRFVYVDLNVKQVSSINMSLNTHMI